MGPAYLMDVVGIDAGAAEASRSSPVQDGMAEVMFEHNRYGQNGKRLLCRGRRRQPTLQSRQKVAQRRKSTGCWPRPGGERSTEFESARTSSPA